MMHGPINIRIGRETSPADPGGRAAKGVGLRSLACWDCGVRIPPGVRMSISFECCVLTGRGLCDEPITHPEES